ncbi:MAG: ssDNA endonuclease and repair protein rad10 [Vezdaea acicularis]|nr:MAG: ssDNA endonuclease and repair protein rad10 [Vezdaea acicularis]
MDDDIDDDADFAAVLEASERSQAIPTASPASNTPGKIQQPKPQALPSRQGTGSILVSSRQKGNSLLNHIRAQPWEYSNITADYVLGATTCALFLSLKYHRIHPEYIYSRIQALGHNYALRILLTLVDINNHEESIKELSKTSLVNNVTVILCWSAAEAGRYVELYKTYENAAPTAIRAHQATSHNEKLMEFITTPRSINKTDAIGLVSNFGSLKAAINARPEEVAMIAGWGEKKVQRWCNTVREPFRVQKAAKRNVVGNRGTSEPSLSRDTSRDDGDEQARVAARLGVGSPSILAQAESIEAEGIRDLEVQGRPALDTEMWEPGQDEEEALIAAAAEEEHTAKARRNKDELSSGIAAALSKLRDNT